MRPTREGVIQFPTYSGLRCLMMPYIQGDPDSVPEQYAPYAEIVRDVVIQRGDVGFLTIDESIATEGKAHRGARAKHGRALHTEAGLRPGVIYAWGDPSPYTWGSPPPSRPTHTWGTPVHTWGSPPEPERRYGWGDPTPTWGETGLVTLDRDVQILLANNVDDSCAVWDAEHENTSLDGDIGHEAAKYPYAAAAFLKAGEVWRIGILTPHESLPVTRTVERQFLRIISSGVHGREPYFTENPLLN